MIGEGEGDRLLQRLHGEATARLRESFAPRSQGMVKSALKAFGRFAAVCPRRELFREPRATGDREAMAHNEWTLILFATYLSSTTSERTRRVVSAATVKSYISLIKGYLGHVYAFELTEKPTRLKRFLESLQADDRGQGQRRRRRALRRRHLLRMWERIPAVRSHSVRAVNELAMLSTTWHVLARGGEVAPKEFSPLLNPTRADIEFKSTKEGKQYVVLWLRPLKKKVSKHTPKIPQFIREFDGGGADTYWALRRLVMYDPVPKEQRATTSLFRAVARSGRRHHFTTEALRELVRRRMAQIGEDRPEEWGAHSGRIGGATDLASTGELDPQLLRAKGRWGSDIGRIYARATRRSMLEASERMHHARGKDLEEIFPHYSQPAC